jgi:hypothetical protein
MSKEAQMTFRVETKLRAEFSEAALLEDRPAAQVLREFMKAYVSRARERSYNPANDAISEDESRRREKAINFARGSVALEGFKPHKADDDLSRRYISGEINVADAIREIDEFARKR